MQNRNEPVAKTPVAVFTARLERGSFAQTTANALRGHSLGGLS